MNNKGLVESMIGFLVLLLAIFSAFFMYYKGGLGAKYGNSYYQIDALFTNVDGLKDGDIVKISGVNIGYVEKIIIEPKNYKVKVQLNIAHDISLPDDTQALISGSLFGDKYVVLLPGASEELLHPMDSIVNTQPSINLENLIGKFIFGDTK